MKRIIITLCCLCVLVACCMSMPDKNDYAGGPQACYDFDRCMYYNQKNTDKSICAPFARDCSAYRRFEYCKDAKNLPDNIRFQECWDKLD